ncbi:hypothetical protein BC332_23435 [Capsicum chinense]|nr:hypothetical protein BC332_23435 [Capsicum chinense]
MGKVILEKAPQNDTLTCPMIQKDIVNSCAKETLNVIIGDLNGDYFGILVDESKDISHKEQMALVFRTELSSVLRLKLKLWKGNTTARSSIHFFRKEKLNTGCTEARSEATLARKLLSEMVKNSIRIGISGTEFSLLAEPLHPLHQRDLQEHKITDLKLKIFSLHICIQFLSALGCPKPFSD